MGPGTRVPGSAFGRTPTSRRPSGPTLAGCGSPPTAASGACAPKPRPGRASGCTTMRTACWPAGWAGGPCPVLPTASRARRADTSRPAGAWDTASACASTDRRQKPCYHSARPMSDRTVTSADDVLRLQSYAFRASLDGMAILDAEERYVFLNEAYARLYGYEAPEELVGKSWRILCGPSQLQRLKIGRAHV